MAQRLAEHPTCTLCRLFPARIADIFCTNCRTRVEAHITLPLLIPLLLRYIMMLCIEALLAIFNGFLTLIPISAASSGQLSLHRTIFTFCLMLGFIAIIHAALYEWTIRTWIRRSYRWALASTVGALSGAILMLGVVVFGGLRLQMLPDSVLTGCIAIAEWISGMIVARWQATLLIPPYQQRAIWQRWTLIGWTVAASVHIGIGFFVPGWVSIWLGTTIAFFLYNLIVHTTFLRFMSDTHAALNLKQQYNWDYS